MIATETHWRFARDGHCCFPPPIFLEKRTFVFCLRLGTILTIFSYATILSSILFKQSGSHNVARRDPRGISVTYSATTSNTTYLCASEIKISVTNIKDRPVRQADPAQRFFNKSHLSSLFITVFSFVKHRQLSISFDRSFDKNKMNCEYDAASRERFSPSLSSSLVRPSTANLFGFPHSAHS